MKVVSEMKAGRYRGYLTLIIMFLAVLLISMPWDSAMGNEIGKTASQEYESLNQKAAAEGRVKVIVKLAVPGIEEKMEASRSFRSVSPGEVFSSDAVQADLALAQAIGSASDSVIQGLAATEYKINHTYSTVPFLAMDVSLEALSALQSMPSVISIIEDRPVMLDDPLESESTSSKIPSTDNTGIASNLKLIGVDVAWQKGYTGAGWYVAVLDTGIRADHEMFRGKTIVEACFSEDDDCPNQSNEMTGPVSAAHYYDYSAFYPGYEHGTHVAGIAAGNSGTVFGVAKDAGIIAVQVFSRLDGIDKCVRWEKCIHTWPSDQLKGLEYVYSIRGNYSIAAVNMSLGGGAYYYYCDDDPRKEAIDNLRAVGIATIIASGNNGFCGAISNPSCVSSSVSVGATDNDDVETWFSNWNQTLVDFFAPGDQIYSATAASSASYGYKSGTSMATPHVAGAWVLMKQAELNGDVTELYNALKDTGGNPTTRCGAASRPRINVGNAIGHLKGVLSAPVLSATVNGTSVTVSWNSVPTATSYVLYWGSYFFYDWDVSQQIPMGTATTLTAELPAGTYYAGVRAFNDAGSSDYSNLELFTVGTP
jgi:subtilisin family serine protease